MLGITYIALRTLRIINLFYDIIQRDHLYIKKKKKLGTNKCAILKQ